MTDSCREEFEKWINAGFSPIYVTGMKDDRYTCTWVADCWEGWQAGWKVSPPPVNRDGWLTENDIEEFAADLSNTADLSDVHRNCVLADMARAAISLHAERAALLEKLRGVIETIERWNV